MTTSRVLQAKFLEGAVKKTESKIESYAEHLDKVIAKQKARRNNPREFFDPHEEYARQTYAKEVVEGVMDRLGMGMKQSKR